MDVLIVPTHERPEMLWCCLDALACCDDIRDVEVRIHEDIHTDRPKSPVLKDEILRTIQHAHEILPRVTHVRTEHKNHGCSHNVITAFRSAANSDAELVHFVEDDCWVTYDWLRFCKRAHQLFQPFAVVGNPPPRVPHGDEAAVYLCDTWFQTFALSFERKKLSAMLEAYRESSDPRFEWDAYVMEYITDTYQVLAMPHVPRVYHYGFYSYHLGGQPSPGTLADRVQYIKEGAKDTRLLPAIWNFEPFPRRAFKWRDLYRQGSSIRRKP
jgi:hypothetical protein